MTTTHFLCLANSKKYGERCIAGIELRPDNQGQFHAIKKDGKPKWIRPVSSVAHGHVPAEWVEDIAVGDIVEVTVSRPCPLRYQVENAFFEKKSLHKVRPAIFSAAHIGQLAETMEMGLFGNTGRCLDEAQIDNANCSLVLVKAERPTAYFTTPWNTKPRLKFLHHGCWYDLPMTDVNFFDRMQENPHLLDNCPDVFLTISLGVCFEGKYYKLAAGIVLPQAAVVIQTVERSPNPDQEQCWNP